MSAPSLDTLFLNTHRPTESIQTHRRTYRRTHGHTDAQTVRHTWTCTHTGTEIHTDMQTHRLTHIETEAHAYTRTYTLPAVLMDVAVGRAKWALEELTIFMLSTVCCSCSPILSSSRTDAWLEPAFSCKSRVAFINSRRREPITAATSGRYKHCRDADNVKLKLMRPLLHQDFLNKRPKSK